MGIDLIFYGLVATAFLLALGNWRAGLYAAVVLDVLRDPVRKLLDGYPPGITVCVAIVWLGIFLGAVRRQRGAVRAVLRLLPSLRLSVQLFVIALIPGAALSLVAYAEGWRLAAIGGASYLGPLLGLAVGFVLAGDQREMYRFAGFFSVINGVALLGTLAEFQGADWPILGGMGFEWIRHKPGVIIRLISGIYRSPDIMGIHAAHVCMFSAMLAMKPRTYSRWFWIGLAGWAAVCLLLGGRRKSIGMPLVFVVSYYLIGVYRRVFDSTRLAQLATVGALVGCVAYMVTREADISDGHLDYASTLLTEGGHRTNEIIAGSVFSTLRTSGVLGAGLGTTTQGRQHVMKQGAPRAWQEDGGSRLFMELGVFGVVFVAFAFIAFGQAAVAAIRSIPARHPLQLLQIGVAAVVLANLASFLISHQQYSGDPAFGMMVCMLVGFVMSCPLSRELAGYEVRRDDGRPIRGRRGQEAGGRFLVRSSWFGGLGSGWR